MNLFLRTIDLLRYTTAARGTGRTGNGQGEDVSWRLRFEGDLESGRGGERLHEVAHHVHLRPLGELRLAPEYRVVEQVEVVRVELALERHAGTDVDDELLTT